MKNFKKTLKRSLAAFLVVLMLLTSAPLDGFVGLELPDLGINADAALMTVEICDGLTCEITSASPMTLTFIGDGIAIPGDGMIEDAFLGVFDDFYRTSEIVISEGIVSIEPCAFSGFTEVTTVTIPTTVTEIGYMAFGNELTDVYYLGTQEEWELIAINEDNEEIFNAKIHYHEPTLDDVIICVPEIIYMSPKTGASVSGQYFVNNIVDANGKVTLATDAADTTGQINIYAPGATAFSLDVTAAVGSIGEPVIGGSSTDANNTYEGTTWNFSDFGNASDYATFDGLQLFINGTGVSMGSMASIKWAVTLTYSTGNVTYYVYSTLYSPYLNPVGSAILLEGRYYSNNKLFASSMAWVSGVHSFTNDPAANYYARTDTMVPLLGEIGTGDNEDNPDTNWISSSAGSNTLSTATFRYNKVTGSSGKLGAIGVYRSPVANITIDKSRYTNLNQIPNLTVGFNYTDKENSGEVSWYVADYTSGDMTYMTDYSYIESRDKVNSQAANYYDKKGTEITSGTSVNTGEEHNSTWNRAVLTSADSNLYVFKTGAYAYRSYLTGKGAAYSVNYIQLRGTNVDKSELRKLVLQCSSLNKDDCEYDWDEFIQAYETASYVLGDPSATESEISAASSCLADVIQGNDTDSAAYTVSNISEWNAAVNSDNSNISIILISDIIANGTSGLGLATIPSGVTVNLYMNGKTIQWYNVATGNMDIISTSYPFANTYWGMITNNGTLNITGTGTISQYQVRYDNENSANQDNYGAKSAAIVNNGELTIGSGITVENYMAQANTEGNKYQDMFIYSHGIYNTGTVTSSGTVQSGSFAMGTTQGGFSSTNSYTCAYSYGIFGGSVTVKGGNIYSEAKSGFDENSSITTGKKGNKAYNIAVGVYSNNAIIYGNSAITTKATSWRDDTGDYNLWADGENMSWSVGVLYAGSNYPYIGADVNINSAFQYPGETDLAVTFPELNNKATLFSYTRHAKSEAGTYGRRAYTVAGIPASNTTAMAGLQSSEVQPKEALGVAVNGDASSTIYRSELELYNNLGTTVTSTDNMSQSGGNTGETKTSYITMGAPGTTGGQYMVYYRYRDQSGIITKVSATPDTTINSAIKFTPINGVFTADATNLCYVSGGQVFAEDYYQFGGTYYVSKSDGSYGAGIDCSDLSASVDATKGTVFKTSFLAAPNTSYIIFVDYIALEDQPSIPLEPDTGTVNEIINGTCSDNLIWSLDTSVGELKISGTGYTYDYLTDDAPWYSYRTYIKTVSIDYGITHIGDGAFYGCNNIDTVNYYGNKTEWQEIVIGEHNTHLTNAAINCFGCEHISTEVKGTVDASCSANGYSGDTYCVDCQRLLATGNVTTSDHDYVLTVVAPSCTEQGYTIYTCSVCGDTYVDDYTAVISHISNDGDELCDECGANLIANILTYEISDGEVTITDCIKDITGELIIPATIEGYPVTAIGAETFFFCEFLESITIPASVSTIFSKYRYGTFSYCKSLKNVAFAEGCQLTKIDIFTFEGCIALEEITIPVSVTEIEKNAFAGCTNLKSVAFADGSLLTEIYAWAFDGCESLEEITIPEYVEFIDDDAFNGCKSLVAINVDENNESYCSEGGILYRLTQHFDIFAGIFMLELVRYPEGKTENSFVVPPNSNKHRKLCILWLFIT